MRLTRLVLKDFLTFEELDYTFESKPLLVQGENLTDDGQKTNGVGKSGIPTAIEQCITGTNSRGVNDSELITYGKNQCTIQLFAECDVRKEKIHISNIINLKGSNQYIVKVRSYEGAWRDADYSTSPEGKKFVSDWFAIAKEDLFNYFIINNTRFKSFFASSNTEKVGLVNRFSDASIVQGIEDVDLTELEDLESSKLGDVNSVLGKIELTEGKITAEKERDFTKELEDESLEIDEEIEELEDEIETLKTSIVNNNKLKPTINNKIQEYKDQKSVNDKQKENFEKEVKSIEKEVNSAKKSVENAQELVDSFEEVDFEEEKKSFENNKSTEKKKKTPLVKSKEENEEKRKKVLKIIEDAEIKLSGTITCPSCNHKFLLKGDLDEIKKRKTIALGLKEAINTIIKKKETEISTIEKSISRIEENISEINSRESKWNTDKNKLTTSLNNLTSTLNKVKSNLKSKELSLKTLELTENTRLSNIKLEEGKLTTIANNNQLLQDKIDLKNSSIKTLETKKENLKLSNNKLTLKNLNTELIEYRKELGEKQLKLLEVRGEISEMKQWSLNFKQFRMYLANKSLGVIEYHCNRYLRGMGTDLLVKVEGFKVLADSTIREEITCKVIRNAIERNFKSFSGGERGRLLFSSILANRFMINETHPYGGLDFLSIDEVFEGVDSEGLVSLIESAKLLTIPVLLITHVTVEENDNVLTIVKENGISKIKY